MPSSYRGMWRGSKLSLIAGTQIPESGQEHVAAPHKRDRHAGLLPVMTATMLHIISQLFQGSECHGMLLCQTELLESLSLGAPVSQGARQLSEKSSHLFTVGLVDEDLHRHVAVKDIYVTYTSNTIR
eukprot:4245061-Amphidinium_carterae.1